MPEISSHRHHAIDYVELTVTDLEQAKRFYAAAFGWNFNDYGPQYAGIQSPQGGSVPEVGGLRRDRDVRPGGPLVLTLLGRSRSDLVGSSWADPFEPALDTVPGEDARHVRATTCDGQPT